MSEKVGALPVKLVSQTAYVAGAVMLAAPVKVFSISGTSKGAGASWVQVFDSATTPIDTSVPIFTAYVAASAQNFNLDFGFHGLDCKTGLYVCNSSTAATKTIGAADYQIFARLTPDY